MMIRHSQPYMLIVFVAGLILIGIVLATLHHFVVLFYNMSYQNEYVLHEPYQTFFRRMRTLWVLLPVAVGIGLTALMVIKSHQREY